MLDTIISFDKEIKSYHRNKKSGMMNWQGLRAGSKVDS